jgi:hypothetical protein
VAILVVAGGILSGMRTKEGGQGQGPPPPPFSGALDTLKRPVVLGYARGLGYETAFGATDEQRLMVGTSCPPWQGGNCTYGPLVRIEPQAQAHAIPDSGVLVGGRIVARIIAVDSAYPKLNLRARDTTYWWIFKSGGRWRSTFVSSDTSVSLVTDTTYRIHPTPRGFTWRQSIARFVWRDSDEAAWVTCVRYGCCQPM